MSRFVSLGSEFGLLFYLAAEKTGTKITHHGFDNAVVQIDREDMTKFMDYLNTALLAQQEQEAHARSRRHSHHHHTAAQDDQDSSRF